MPAAILLLVAAAGGVFAYWRSRNRDGEWAGCSWRVVGGWSGMLRAEFRYSGDPAGEWRDAGDGALYRRGSEVVGLPTRFASSDLAYEAARNMCAIPRTIDVGIQPASVSQGIVLSGKKVG